MLKNKLDRVLICLNDHKNEFLKDNIILNYIMFLLVVISLFIIHIGLYPTFWLLQVLHYYNLISDFVKPNPLDDISYFNEDLDKITYFYKDKPYYMLIPRIGKKARYIFNITGDGNDVTDYITPFLGPRQNTHKYITMTPRLFGFDEMVFNTIHKGTLRFDKDDVITV